jgi:choline dehydrogenase-like flavoprotein
VEFGACRASCGPPTGRAAPLLRREVRYGLRTNDYKSVWKLGCIARGHRRFFDALGKWIEQDGWIVFTKGNHDLELYWPLVQRAVRREIERAHPAAQGRLTRVLFRQAGFQLANLYIEHGHAFEAMTAVKGPPTLPKTPSELNLPLGSFVNRYIINKLEGLNPFLDNIKPVQGVLWAVVRQYPLKVFSIAWNGITFLGRAIRPYWLRDALGFGLFFLTIAAQFVAIAGLLLFLVWPGFRHFLITALPTARYVLGLLGLFGPYIVGSIRELFHKRPPKVGEDAFGEGIYRVVSQLGFCADYPRVYGVVGHTHVADVQRLPDIGGAKLVYLNSGTWIPLWEVNRPDLTGHVVHSFIRFTKKPGGWYAHEHLEWQPLTLRATASVILDRGREAVPGSFFSPRERRTVEAFAEVFIEGQGEVLSPAQIGDNLDAHLMRVHSKRTASLRLVLFFIEYLLPLLSLRGPFSRLSRATRRRLIIRHISGPRAGWLGRDLAKIRALFFVGYYGDPRVFDSIRFTPPNRQARYRPGDLRPLGNRPQVTLGPPAVGETVIKTDVCVIGSGAGGAVVAYHAAASGARVVVLEEGRHVRSCEISHNEPVMSAMLYKEGGLQSTVDLEMTILQGRALGGTTTINNAICFRLDDPALDPGRDTLRRWSELGALIDPQELRASYEAVDRMICARPLPNTLAPPATAQGHTPAGTNGDALLQGWKALVDQGLGDQTFKAGLFRVNFIDCLACGYCNFGCPYERRMSVLETYLPQAVAAGARLITQCHAVAIKTHGRRARSVRAELADGRSLVVEADRIVVACGTIGSSVLLMKSGITRNVGSRFSCNIATPVLARFPRPLAGYEALQMTAYVDARDFLLESTFNPPLAFAAILPGWFQTHFDRMRDYERFVCAGVVLGTAAEGTVKRSQLLRDLFGPVGYRVSDDDLATLKRGMALLAEVHFAAGATSVIPGTFVDSEMTADRFAPGGRIDTVAIERRIAEVVRGPRDLTLNTAHPQGGNPMSDRPRLGVVDSNFRVHGFENLFVCDASVFPTSIGINPQWTIMALADYAWRLHIR